MTPEIRQRLAEMAAEARRLVYGEKGCPEWGTKFVEIEADAFEVGQEFIRVLMAGVAAQQAEEMPVSALQAESGEVAAAIGSEERTLETTAGGVSWKEPKAYLPQSRKAFFPSVASVGPGR
jgi:hypothetical protein